MYFLTRTCGLLFLGLALVTVILSFVDTAPEVISAADILRKGDFPLPIATSVKYKIGGEVLFDVIAVAAFALFGWFLWTSEIQQTWAVVITFLLLAGAVTIRVTPLLSMDVGRHSPGLIFWGAMVVDDFYPSPLKPGAERRGVSSFPPSDGYALAVTEQNLSGQEPHPAESVVLNFASAPGAVGNFVPGGVQITGKLAGTRTVLDWDHEKEVYSVPHMMVQSVTPPAARYRSGR
ncbi:MAG: hypothetical protein U9R79_10960 [Armatimonadota bacterium]|nr:hypothetical protein [Armatimonadota bacterium]